VEGRSKPGHSRREASGGSANELRKCNMQLLVRPDRGLCGQLRDLLEEAGSLMGRRGAGLDGLFDGLRASEYNGQHVSASGLSHAG